MVFRQSPDVNSMLTSFHGTNVTTFVFVICTTRLSIGDSFRRCVLFMFCLLLTRRGEGSDFDELSKKATGVTESNLALPNQFSVLKNI